MTIEMRDERTFMCEQAREVWEHALPEKFWHSEIASETIFGPKSARISPPVVSVARKAIEPSCQK